RRWCPPPIPPRYVPGLSGMVVLRPSQCSCAAGNWRPCFRAAVSCSLGATVAQIYDRGDIRPKRAALEVIKKTETTEIHQIEAALKRISEGTYGTCAKCGEPIDPRRLKALPTAPTCISCSA